MESVFIFLTDDFEEIEALATCDILRRGGVNVKTVSITGNRSVKGAHGMVVETDELFESIKDKNATMYILPGGAGALQYPNHESFMISLKEQYEKGGYVAAICAAPLALGHVGIAKGKNVVCYPGFEEYLKDSVIKEDGVLIGGTIITARGPAFALPFGFALLELLKGTEVTQEVKAGMLIS